jgi:hypothetical protein
MSGDGIPHTPQVPRDRSSSRHHDHTVGNKNPSASEHLPGKSGNPHPFETTPQTPTDSTVKPTFFLLFTGPSGQQVIRMHNLIKPDISLLVLGVNRWRHERNKNRNQRAILKRLLRQQNA